MPAAPSPSAPVPTPSTDPDPSPSFARILGATITGNLYLVLGTFVFSVLTILVSILPPRGLWTYRVARLWAQGLLLASWIPLRRTRPGAPAAASGPALPPAGSVFLVNHQSLFDIPALLAAIPFESRFLAKRSLF